MDREGYTTKSGYLTFETVGMYKINWRPTGVQLSESIRYPRGETCSESNQKPTVSSTIPIPEEYFKMLTLTPRLVEHQTTRGTKRFSQPDIPDVNLDESSHMTSVKGMDPAEASSAALHLSPASDIKQVGENEKVSNSNSWKYLTGFILDVIKSPEVGTKEIPTPQQVSS